MGVGPRLAAVELEMAGAALARPSLGGLQQRLADALGSAVGIHRQVLDPAAGAEADRVQVEVCAADPD